MQRPLALLSAGALSLISAGASARSAGPVRASADPVIAAAGDIACDPSSSSFNNGNGTSSNCRHKYTAALLAGVDAVLPLGDVQYEDGNLQKYSQSYARPGNVNWGTYKSITRPAPGNHDYLTQGAAGYFAYFGSAAGDPAKGYYSWDLGQWHLIALNSEISHGSGSTQESWLRGDLAGTRQSCILAYWHKPRFSSGTHGSDAGYNAFWQALYDARADVVLSGHDHTYERFAPQNAAGQRDDARGIRQFVSGMGGKSRYSFPTVRPNSEVRNNSVYGVLKIVLHANSYDWQFVAETGSIIDSGSTGCHPAGPTAVSLVSFSARRTNGGVLLRWKTASETQTLGFHLYRDRGGRLTRLNKRLIPASGHERGATYSRVDRLSSTRGVRYRLQSIGPEGRGRWLGAASVVRR